MVPKISNHYVPWSSIDEWNTVRDQIKSLEMVQLTKALQTILIWKLRFHDLPAYVESTLSILQVIVKEYYTDYSNNFLLSMLEEHDLKLTYSMALIRFVNHVSSLTSDRCDSMYYSAKTNKLPDWIINMRHDAAHSQSLPDLDAFHLAAEVSLKWLLENYWLNKVDQLEENHLNDDFNYEINDNSIAFFKKAFKIWTNCFSKKKSFLNEESRVLIEDLLCMKQKCFDHIESCEFTELMKIMTCNKSIQNENECVTYGCTKRKFKILFLTFLKDVALENNQMSFIEALLGSSFIREAKLSVKPWIKILQLTQKISMLHILISNLFRLCSEGQKRALEWLIILFPSLKVLCKEWTIFKMLKKKHKNKTNLQLLKKEIKGMSIVGRNLAVVDLEICKPPAISLDMMTCVLLKPETLPIKWILKYMNFIKPALPDCTIIMVKDLLNLYLKGKGIRKIKESKMIYTVNDLNSLLEKKVDTNEEDVNGGGWAKSKIGVQTWSKCPLGLVPSQSQVNLSIPVQETTEWKVPRKSKRLLFIKYPDDVDEIN